MNKLRSFLLLTFAFVWLMSGAQDKAVSPEPDQELTLKSGAKLLLYKAQADSTDKMVIVCPGGGYRFLSVDNEGKRIADFYSKNGVSSVVLLYRLPDGNDTVPLTDVREALDVVRGNAKEWGGYTKVGIMGSSAGGHLASTAATHIGKAGGIDFHVLFYPVVTMDSTFTHKGSRERLLGQNPSRQLVDYYSNELQVNSNTPRAIVFLSMDDRTVPPANTLRYVEALLRNKVPVSVHAYPNGGHGWGFKETFYFKDCWRADLLKWLSQF